MRHRSAATAINPVLGVVPASLKFAHSSILPAPARSAESADSRVSTAASTSGNWISRVGKGGDSRASRGKTNQMSVRSNLCYGRQSEEVEMETHRPPARPPSSHPDASTRNYRYLDFIL